MNFIYKYIISLLIFLSIDIVWLTANTNTYKKYIGHLMSEKPNLLAAFIFYLIFILGLLVFVINPNLENSMIKIILMALLFGFVTYATYDLTNLATLKDWPIKITIIDLIWGGTVSALTSVLSVIIIKFFKL